MVIVSITSYFCHEHKQHIPRVVYCWYVLDKLWGHVSWRSFNGLLSRYQFVLVGTTTHFQIRCPYMKSTGTRSANGLNGIDECVDKNHLAPVMAARDILIPRINNHLPTLRPRQNGRHFADDIFKWIFLNENVWTSIKISLKFVPRGPISNIPALVQIMAWRRSGDKPLSEPMMVRLLTHICVTRPQWVKCGMKLLIHSYTSTVQSFEKDKQFPPTKWNGCNYLSMLGTNPFNPC